MTANAVVGIKITGDKEKVKVEYLGKGSKKQCFDVLFCKFLEIWE